ncbi:hypothetical protein SVIO_088090 [Streptomyces violaceusniger]|uniref:Uncharacterized protein n=1 Tax=Streptomyces violaceusniger TaxID=68280 RepID=A0A4D4LG05_STRVO|nr:hypothetical protein SVIO_088090 [Streptomyces violaceusniger]
MAGTADELDGQDAVAAQSEEAVLRSGLGYGQYVGEQLAQCAFVHVGGGPFAGALRAGDR